MAKKARSTIGPDYGSAGIAQLGGIDLDRGPFRHQTGGCVGHAGIFALPATAHQHFAAALCRTGIQAGGAFQPNFVRRGVNHASTVIQTHGFCRA